MANQPLSLTVVASSKKTSWRSSILSLLTSTAIQMIVIAALIVTPLVAAQTLPEPVSRMSLPRYVAVVRVEPPPATTTKPPPSARTTKNPATPPTTKLVVQPIFPDEIAEQAHEFGTSSGIETAGVVGGIGDGTTRSVPFVSAPKREPEPDPEPVRIGDVRPPRKIHHVNPVYPHHARAAHQEGTVRLQAIIDVQGRVSDLKVVVSVLLLDRAAIEAVSQWRYEPTLLNGRKVPVIMTVSVKFTLQ